MDEKEYEYLKGQHDAFLHMEQYAKIKREEILESIDRGEEDTLLTAIKAINEGLEAKIGNVIIFKGGKQQ